MQYHWRKQTGTLPPTDSYMFEFFVLGIRTDDNIRETNSVCLFELFAKLASTFSLSVPRNGEWAPL